MTTISRKEVLDLLDHIRKEEVCDQKEDDLIRLIAQEILRFNTYEVEQND